MNPNCKNCKKKMNAPTSKGVGVPTVSVGKEDLEEGAKLCPKCGNLMIEENGEFICSSCVNELDFFGEDEPED